MAKAHRPDVMLLDIVLEGSLDGIQAVWILLRELDIPVIFVTAHADEATLACACNADPCAIIMKPVRRHIFEKRLREYEERYRLRAENARDFIYRMSLPDRRYEFVSPSIEGMIGVTPGECYGSPLIIHEYIHPDWRGYLEEQWTNLLRGEMPTSYQHAIVKKSGEVRWLHQRNTLIRAADGTLRAIEAIVTDVTERKNNEDEREMKNAKLPNALGMTSTLSGILPICSSCKKIRDAAGGWRTLEDYIRQHSRAEFTHGLCPDCLYDLHPDLQNSGGLQKILLQPASGTYLLHGNREHAVSS
jgi:PAS domain S-box-containing protein